MLAWIILILMDFSNYCRSPGKSTDDILDIAPPMTSVETRTKQTVAMAVQESQRNYPQNRKAKQDPQSHRAM